MFHSAALHPKSKETLCFHGGHSDRRRGDVHLHTGTLQGRWHRCKKELSVYRGKIIKIVSVQTTGLGSEALVPVLCKSMSRHIDSIGYFDHYWQFIDFQLLLAIHCPLPMLLVQQMQQPTKTYLKINHVTF